MSLLFFSHRCNERFYMGKDFRVDAHTRQRLELDSVLTLNFDLILQRGFIFITHVGRSIRSFLRDELGLSPDYIEEKISTVFLDSRPVDDLESTIIRNDSELTLSAAMPGLVGVTLKRGSILASFRETITHRETNNIEASEEGTVHIKLFNIMMRELGPVFLARGILVRASVLSEFIENSMDAIREKCSKIILNGKSVKPHKFHGLTVSQGERVFLQVVEVNKDHRSRGDYT